MRDTEHHTGQNEATPTEESRLAMLADSGWLRLLIGGLAALSLLTLAGTFSNAGGVGSRLAILHAVTGGALFVALGLWLVANRRALSGMRRRDRAWQQSIDSMNVGIALYGPDDRLLDCNPAFRALYPEVAELLIPGALYADVLRAYFERAPAEVINGRSLEQFLADANRRRSGSEITETVRHANGRWLMMTDCRTAEGGIISIRRDVTEQKLIEHELSTRRRLIDDLAELTYDWFWRQDAEGRFVEFSSTMQRFVGVGSDELIGKKRAEMPGFDPDPALHAAYCDSIAKREPFPWFTYKARRPDGRTIWIAVTGKPIFDDKGTFQGYYGAGRDVTEREETLEALRRSEERFRALTELSSDWYWEMDEELRFTLLKRGARDALVLADEDVLGKHQWELAGELIQPSSWDEQRSVLALRRPFRDVMVRRWLPDGSFMYHLSSGDPVFDGDGRFRGYRGIGKNITEQVGAQERIERLATVDSLTQLANRQTFDERASRLLSSAYSADKRCALLFIDLDNFRLLNNGYGHRVGDQMLSIVASRMRDIIGEPNLLGRRGGDELVALLVDIPRAERAVEVAQALIKSISEPARILGMEVSVTPSVGISFFPQDGVDLDSLLNAADAAMYQAKDSGRRTFAFYTPTVARRVDLRLRLEQRLRKAVESRDFKLFYQPLVSLTDGKMTGAEALIRWRDAELGDISPAEFIPIAEESGLIVSLGDWVVREACRCRQEWRMMGLDVPPVSINMAGVQLRQLGCVEGLLDVLNEFGVAPSEVEIEVTETGLLDTSAVSRENLVRMRNAGMRIALDDFGVGFSSLAHLRDLPIHRLKIDRSFTVECMRDARTLTIVKAVIEMARSLGINVTAEGIETQAQQTWMQHLGCDSAQGYLFARPMSADDFLKLFIDRRGVGRERSLMH
jgi:diguanylate cyclase (GGDEF)-like protein/PAS domain S-box-containing protein